MLEINLEGLKFTMQVYAEQLKGPPPDPLRITNLGGALHNLEEAMESSLRFSFFITKDMKVDLQSQELNGTLPILYVFLARADKFITDVQFISLNRGGTFKQSAPGRNGAPRWRLRGGKPVKYLAYSAQSGLGRIVAARWGTKDQAFTLETIFTSHLAATLQSMARAGDGVAWLPRTLAEDDISAGLLVEAGDADLKIPIEIRLFRPVARQSHAVEAIWAAFERN